MYNKVANDKWKNSNPEQYGLSIVMANKKYRLKNRESVKLQQRNYIRQFRDFKRLRNIELF